MRRVLGQGPGRVSGPGEKAGHRTGWVGLLGQTFSHEQGTLPTLGPAARTFQETPEWLPRSLAAAHQTLGADPAGPARHCHSGLKAWIENGEGQDARPRLAGCLHPPLDTPSSLPHVPSPSPPRPSASCPWIPVPPAQKFLGQHPWLSSSSPHSLKAVPSGLPASGHCPPSSTIPDLGPAPGSFGRG